ncbi:WD40 repeat-like protein [Microthyrium microscopicum]|uniref:WD40 repeat-like protein n=1 Tax=Microthyrium microscopicum TaxID=703497 RepID=A0A6A6UCQ4_9PEZI|nr:WD40 repeat-like protein [Microthyrium microscopicum]
MNNGGPAAGDHGPAGTEYTLQGVMRFLQIEWHNHERARNAWDIERAEMKQKITKMQGENNHLKRTTQILERHVKMLEKVLVDERAKSKAANAGEKPSADDKDDIDLKAKAALKAELKNGKSLFTSILDSDPNARDAESNVEIEKSRKFLNKCVEEITYLLLPPSHPPPPLQPPQQMGNSSSYLNQDGPPQMTMEELFMQRQKAQHQTNPLHVQQQNHHQQFNNDQDQNRSMPVQHHPQSELMSREPYQMPFSNSTLLSSAAYSNNQDHGYQNNANNFQRLEEAQEKLMNPYQGYSGHPQMSKEDSREAFVFGDVPVVNDEPSDPQQTTRPDKDQFPSANSIPVRSPPRTNAAPHRRRSSGSGGMARRRSQEPDAKEITSQLAKSEPTEFKVRFALRGHLDVVRSVIFTGGGSPSEPEICSSGDDGMIKRWIIPASYSNFGPHGSATDLDIQSFFTHRGHDGVVTSLAAAPATANFATGGRASGDGWIFSGGQDSTIRVWERGRVDPKATLHGHTDAVWSICVLPGSCQAIFGSDGSDFGSDRILIASGSADGTVKIWAVSAPPQLASPQAGSRRGVGGSRRHSVTSGSNYPSSPQPSIATTTPFHYSLIHSIERPGSASPTSISPLSSTGENFVVAYNDSSILIYDTRTGEEIIGMASNETYDGTPATGVNAVVATSLGLEGSMSDIGRGLGEDDNVGGPTGSMSHGGVEGVIISGHEDQFIRFFDANSGQCTYNMLAHTSAISSLSLSKDGREAVSAGHDASIRFWSLEKRICTQEITSHRVMRGEGVCSVVWSQDGRFVVSAGGDGVVKVFAR